MEQHDNLPQNFRCVFIAKLIDTEQKDSDVYSFDIIGTHDILLQENNTSIIPRLRGELEEVFAYDLRRRMRSPLPADKAYDLLDDWLEFRKMPCTVSCIINNDLIDIGIVWESRRDDVPETKTLSLRLRRV
jgi:hypothetical protein